MTEIKIQELSFSYDKDTPILSGLTFDVQAGETVGLIGSNGAGKSTLLKILVGLLEGYTGHAVMHGLPVESKQYAEIRKHVGYLFQDSENQLFLSTVYEDVAFGPQNYGCSAEEVDKRVMAALRQVNLENLKDRAVYKMSGGQKKLAAIATVLSMQPEIILMDEPSVALDPRNRRNLIRILREIPGTKLIASHDLDMISQLCERTILLSEGHIVKIGPTRELLADETLLLESGL